MLERLDLDDSLIPNQHLVLPGSSELSYTASLASSRDSIMLLTTQGVHFRCRRCNGFSSRQVFGKYAPVHWKHLGKECTG